MLLSLIYFLPQDVKNHYFILNTTELWKVQTYFLYAYTHSQLFPHLISNLIFYIATLLAIFSLENNRKRFWVMVSSSLLITPLFTSILTIGFGHILGRDINSQGFSGINFALIAYALLIFAIWTLGDVLEIFIHPELFTGSKKRYYLICGLLALMLSLIIWVGIAGGQFVNTGGLISNGIAHFGGFILGSIVFLFFGIFYEKRNYFDGMLGIAISVGILWYINYLTQLINMLKSG